MTATNAWSIARLDWLMGACSCHGCEASGMQAEGQISLTAEASGALASRQSLSSADALDITFSPRPFGAEDGYAGYGPMTPRQRDLKDQLQLPKLSMYPIPPNSSAADSEAERKRKLLSMYQEVALDLHTGMYLTQLTADRDYSDIHCQLMEDMTTLKLDQSNGRIIEFPLTNVSKVYRIVKSDDKFYTPGSALPPAKSAKSEHIVVIEFLRRKLAFVYSEVQIAQRFMICMELLIRRAQQRQALKSLTPTFPPKHPQGSQGPCPTPRQIYESMAKHPERDRDQNPEKSFGNGGQNQNPEKSFGNPGQRTASSEPGRAGTAGGTAVRMDRSL